jgi:hypothetical protein
MKKKIKEMFFVDLVNPDNLRTHEILWIILMSLIANELVTIRSNLNFNSSFDLGLMISIICLLISFTIYTILFFGLKSCVHKANEDKKANESFIAAFLRQLKDKLIFNKYVFDPFCLLIASTVFFVFYIFISPVINLF